MGIKVALEHRTTYRFDRLVTIHPHVVRLRPAPHSRTKIEAYSLTVEPAEHFINWQQDPFGNFLARLVFPDRASELTITVGLVADLKVVNPFDFFIEDYAEHYGFVYPGDLAEDLEPYLRQVDERDPGTGPGALVKQWLEGFAIAPGHRDRRLPGAAERRGTGRRRLPGRRPGRAGNEPVVLGVLLDEEVERVDHLVGEQPGRR